jgi:putative ribosome biogenesis GTPase RsgA
MQGRPANSNQERFIELTTDIPQIKDHLYKDFKANCDDIKTLSDAFKVIVMLGVTGQGKSSVVNSLCGEKIMRTSAGLDSVTSQV